MARTNTGVATAALSLLVVAVACFRDEVVRANPIVLAPGIWTSIPSDVMRVRGEQSEVCVTLPAEYQFADSSREVVGPGSRRVRVRARFVTRSGAHLDSLSIGFLTGDGQRLCFRALGRPIGEAYKAVDFLASDSLPMQSIHWWSGNRRLAL
jgi:hypothetical protein